MSDVVDLSKITEEDLNSIRDRNVQKLNALRQFNVTLDTAAIAARRLDTLIDLILTKEQRIQFEYAFEHQMSDFLDKAHVELRNAQLTQGISQNVGKNSKLIIPGA